MQLKMKKQNSGEACSPLTTFSFQFLSLPFSFPFYKFQFLREQREKKRKGGAHQETDNLNYREQAKLPEGGGSGDELTGDSG